MVVGCLSIWLIYFKFAVWALACLRDYGNRITAEITAKREADG